MSLNTLCNWELITFTYQGDLFSICVVHFSQLLPILNGFNLADYFIFIYLVIYFAQEENLVGGFPVEMQVLEHLKISQKGPSDS